MKRDVLKDVVKFVLVIDQVVGIMVTVDAAEDVIVITTMIMILDSSIRISKWMKTDVFKNVVWFAKL
jgi:hypothetical protein